MKYYDVKIIDNIASQLANEEVSVFINEIKETILMDLIDSVMKDEDTSIEIISSYSDITYEEQEVSSECQIKVM